MAQLGKYQLVAEIARGGMGIVSLAITQGPARFNKLLVVKELKPELVEDASFLEMFLEEARLAARLSHPNIVQTYEVGADGKRHFMVMDYLEGVTLSGILRKKTEAFTLAMHMRVLCETLAALEYAHTLTDFDGTALGIVHRDATPQNVFVTFDGTVKLVDFGIAKALDTSVETRAGVLKGKPAYMAPEQIAGEVDARADVFSVGVMLWEAIVGRRMWHKKGDIEVLTNIIKGQIPTLRETKPDAPEELIRICDKAIAKSRDDRYRSAAALHEDLEAYLSKTGDVSTREVSKAVATVFAKERATTRSVIEEHLASVKAGKTSEKIPSLRPEVDDVSSSPSNAKLDVPRHAEPPSITSPTNPTSPSAAGTPGATAIPTRSADDALAKDIAANRRKAVIGIGAFVAVALAGSAFALRSPEPATAAAGPQASTSAPVVPTFVVPATHEVTLMVHPPTARISVEGVPISNPGTRTCMHGQRVTMHASAAHYLSADRELSCERDEKVEVVLESEPTPDPSASGAPSAAPKK